MLNLLGIYLFYLYFVKIYLFPFKEAGITYKINKYNKTITARLIKSELSNLKNVYFMNSIASVALNAQDQLFEV